MHSFTTERLLIRPLAEQDKELYLSLYTDAKIMRHIGTPFTVEVAEQAFSKTIRAMNKPNPTMMTWAIITLDKNEVIGLEALNFQSPDCAEIGVMLLRRSNGRLLPEEAINGLLEYGFNHLLLQQVNARYASKNLATARVAKKTGFTFIETNQPADNLSIIESVYKNTWRGQYIKTLLG